MHKTQTRATIFECYLSTFSVSAHEVNTHNILYPIEYLTRSIHQKTIQKNYSTFHRIQQMPCRPCRMQLKLYIYHKCPKYTPLKCAFTCNIIYMCPIWQKAQFLSHLGQWAPIKFNFASQHLEFDSLQLSHGFLSSLLNAICRNPWNPEETFV